MRFPRNRGSTGEFTSPRRQTHVVGVAMRDHDRTHLVIANSVFESPTVLGKIGAGVDDRDVATSPNHVRAGSGEGEPGWIARDDATNERAHRRDGSVLERIDRRNEGDASHQGSVLASDCGRQ